MEYAHYAKQRGDYTRAFPFPDVGAQRLEQRFDIAPRDRSRPGSDEDGGQRLGVFSFQPLMVLYFSTKNPSNKRTDYRNS